MIKLTWEKSMIVKNLKDELRRHPELRPLNTKLNTLYSKARTKLKALAEKHDQKLFMDKSSEVIRHFQEVADEVPTFVDFDYSIIKKKAENSIIELKNYSSDCWFYCQGDTRRQI